jgi:hypothetical protein
VRRSRQSRRPGSNDHYFALQVCHLNPPLY